MLNWPRNDWIHRQLTVMKMMLLWYNSVMVKRHNTPAPALDLENQTNLGLGEDIVYATTKVVDWTQ